MKTAKKLALKVGNGLNTHLLKSKKEFSFTETDERFEFTLNDDNDNEIVHNEHDIILLKKGKYISSTQVEYDPFSGNIRNVFD
jgi:hypothetical protein